MEYRRFGKTEISMPVLTCGGMRFQFSWNRSDSPTRESRQRVKSTVSKALELGINHIETAYGYGTSEKEIGDVIKGLPRDSFILQTKASPRKDVNEFLKRIEDSLKILQVDYVDLFAIHGINNEELLQYSLNKGGCLETALKLKEKGVIRHVGFSSHGPAEIILKTMKSGGFAFVNLHWYYFFQDNWPVIIEASNRDMGVLIISPNDKGGKLYDPPERLRQLTSPLSPMAFNDLFCLSRKEVHTLSTGAGKPSDYDEHINALNIHDRREELISEIADRMKKRFNNMLGEEWAETWKEGLPQWHETPGNINIPAILFLWNLVKAYDMIKYGKMRFNLMGNGDHWFPGNRPDSLGKYDFSKCLKNSPHSKKIPAILKEAYDILSGKEVKRLGGKND